LSVYNFTNHTNVKTFGKLSHSIKVADSHLETPSNELLEFTNSTSEQGGGSSKDIQVSLS
jgi:hypothetical protein